MTDGDIDVHVTFGRRASAPPVDVVVTHVRGTDTWTVESLSARPELERAEREYVSDMASASLFRMTSPDLADLLVPKRASGWLLVDLTVTELRAAFRRRAVRENDDVRAGLVAWGTADMPVRVRRDLGTEQVLAEFRAVVDPMTDCVVQALAHRLRNWYVPTRSTLLDIIDHAAALQAVGERYGERGREAAVHAAWECVSVDEFESGITDAVELIEHFTVDGEPIAELLEAGLPDWARPLIA